MLPQRIVKQSEGVDDELHIKKNERERFLEIKACTILSVQDVQYRFYM